MGDPPGPRRPHRQPSIPELDRAAPAFGALAAGNGHVVGPIVRDECAADPAPRAEIDARFGLHGAEYAIVAARLRAAAPGAPRIRSAAVLR
ncbi:hypothetical protein ACWDAZ_28540, partial [Streptomyces sp. NPDC001215]